jgi:CPA2 family monovalent cation:H+ antiporter-2
MSQIPALMSDLAVILCTASIVILVFKKMKQPIVLGYIVAGILTGSAVSVLPTVSDMTGVKIWADIGVVFLLFALGLEFSFKKLFKIGITAIIATLVITAGMMTTGYLAGSLMGWSHMDSLFLGGMISISSTMIVFKALTDLGLRNKHFAGIVLGVLVVEDLVAVVLMVLLSTVAVSHSIEGVEMVDSVLMLGAFLLFWSVMGIFLIPSLLRRMKPLLNDETLLVVALGLCLGMVMLADKAGFSAALGAFVMGSILAETVEAERVERLIKPVKDLFGAIFFVSVGMMINPALMIAYWVPILVVTLTVVVGQLTWSTFGVLLSGKPLRIAIESGFALTQIGEFAFIIAGLGVSLHVTSDFLYPVVVAVSVITTFMTPYMIRLADPAYIFIDNRLPNKWKLFLDRYSARHAMMQSSSSHWKTLLVSLFRIVTTYAVLSVFFIFLFFQYVSSFLKEVIPGELGSWISLILILSIISPFLRAIMIKKNHSEEYQILWAENKSNRMPLLFLILLRIVLCIVIVMYVVTRLITITSGIGLSVASVIIVVFIFSRHLKRHSINLEKRFLKNFMARENEEERKSPIKKEYVSHLLARSLHLSQFEVLHISPSIGKTLKELNFRQVCGVSIVTIIRGEQRINIPSGEERIYPCDKLVVAGTDADLVIFRSHIEHQKNLSKEENLMEVKELVLKQFVLASNSMLVNHTIKDSNIRDFSVCLVVGIERNGVSIMNPTPDTIFNVHDILWVVGEEEQLVKLYTSSQLIKQ